MPIVLDKELYNSVKQRADEIYKKLVLTRAATLSRHTRNWGADTWMITNKRIERDGLRKSGKT